MTLYLSQGKLFLLLFFSFVIGFLLSFVYDFLRFFRKGRLYKGWKGYLFISLEDVLFFSFGGVVFSILFYVTNYGKVRPSAFFLGLLGFLFCRSTLSPLTAKVLGGAALLVMKAWKAITAALVKCFLPLGRSIKKRLYKERKCRKPKRDRGIRPKRNRKRIKES